MAMGNTGTINVKNEMLNNAKQAIGVYRDTTQELYKQIEGIVSGIIPSHFSGSAANGFNNFFTNKIDPLIGDNLTKLLNTLDEICSGILKAIPADEGVDEALASENNKQGEA